MSNTEAEKEQRRARRQIDLQSLNCTSCVPVIERQLKKIDGIESAKVNYLLNRLYVDYDPTKVDESKIELAVEKLGHRLRYKKYESLLHRLLSKFGRIQTRK